jgi:hypothetical protein
MHELLEPYSDEWIAYILELEKERYGPSSTKVVKDDKYNNEHLSRIRLHYKRELEQLEAMREQRDKIMFNAGRYAAGDRDSVAVASNRLLDALIAGDEG